MPRHEPHLIGRRTALGMLGAGAWAARRAVAAGETLRFSGLDHIEFFVSDIQKSVALYAQIFGNTVAKNKQTSRRYLKLGSAYMAMDKGQELRVDHFCVGIEGFQVADMHSYLEQRGIAYRDYPSGKDLSVADPDGIRVQLAGVTSWADFTSSTAAPESVPLSGPPIFRPTGMDHILLNVSDPEKSAEFYAKIFGPVTQRNNNRIWFQAGKSRIGLLQTPAGQRPGVNHYCVSAEPFEAAAAAKKIQEAGGKMEQAEVAGAPEFRDPDQYLVQVMGPRAA